VIHFANKLEAVTLRFSLRESKIISNMNWQHKKYCNEQKSLVKECVKKVKVLRDSSNQYYLSKHYDLYKVLNMPQKMFNYYLMLIWNFHDSKKFS
jgi:hypothetical protein